MGAYYKKTSDEILSQALKKLQEKTPITSTGPGSIARALIEVITDELGDFYSILDFNMSQTAISTATGRSLDLMGDLYNVKRKTLTDLATVDAQVGAFYFYTNNAWGSDILIPRGTQISTSTSGELGRRYSYVTTDNCILLAGRTRAYASLRPLFEDSVFTAGVGTLTTHNFDSPVGVDILCTNPKVISPQIGYESDDNYRTRILKSIRTVSGGTSEGLRWLALSVAGVRDVKITSANLGLGSFEVILTAEDYKIIDQLLDTVLNFLSHFRPVGVRMIMRAPDLQTVNVEAKLIMKAGSVFDSTSVTRRAELSLLRYLNSLLIADPLVYNQMIQAIIDASDVVSDVVITKYSINGQEVLRRNYTPNIDAQLVPGNISVSIAS